MTSPLSADPAEFQTAATYQNEAADEAGTGSTVTADLGKDVWETHGVVSTPSNTAIHTKQTQRAQAGEAIQAACLRLAAQLSASSQTYTTTDDQSAANLYQQMWQ